MTVKPAKRQRMKITYAEDEPEDVASRERTRCYLAAMAEYPKCACGQPLWAPQSIACGRCERCRLLACGS